MPGSDTSRRSLRGRARGLHSEVLPNHIPYEFTCSGESPPTDRNGLDHTSWFDKPELIRRRRTKGSPRADQLERACPEFRLHRDSRPNRTCRRTVAYFRSSNESVLQPSALRFLYQEHLVHFEVCQDLLPAAGPEDLDLFHPVDLAQTKLQVYAVH